MSRRYVLIPVLVTLVVLVVALFPAANVTQRASAAPRAAVVTKYLMIPAAAFNVTTGGRDYYNLGNVVYYQVGGGGFVAPVYLPAGARIRTIKLFAADVNSTERICADLYETHPKGSGETMLKEVCTTGSGGSQQPYKNLSYYVKWYYGYYIMLWYTTSGGLETYAVMLKYTVNQ
jgi:hypothetical protein